MARMSHRRVARGLIAAAVGLAAVAAAAGALPDRGLVRRHLRGDVRPSPSALQSAGSCDGLRAYLVDVIVEQLVRSWISPWRWLGGGPSGFPDAGSGQPSPTDYTSTNNQEQGVDELDIVKTDGRHLYVAMDGWLRILRSWPPEASEQLATLELPGYTHGLFLHRDLVAVLSSGYGIVSPLWEGWEPTTRIDLVGVRDRTAPKLVRTIEVEGSLVGARLIDGELYAVVYTWIPIPQAAWELLWRGDLGLLDLPWDASEAERELAAALARQILRPHVEAIVAALDLDEVLPTLSDRNLVTGATREGSMVACADVFRPVQVGSYGMLTVLHLDLEAIGGDGPPSGVGLFADGWTVYASARTLYVANGQPWWWWLDEASAHASVHKFALGDPKAPVRYVASGSVPGYLLNQFAMSEHDGHLRVATTELGWWWPSSDDRGRGSAITVLRDDGRGALATVGQIKGIAPGERIFASRFFGPVGFLVTYEQVDPLFTLDLSDPTVPRLVGELVLPGFSTYLHPAGDGYLLAVGRTVDDQNRLAELVVNLFDVRDLAHPKLAHQHVIARGNGSWVDSEALWDHHAFTFHRGVLTIPVALNESWDRWFSGIVAMRVDPAEGIGELGRVDHGDLVGDAGWVWMRRSVYVEDFLYSLSNLGLKASVLQRPDNVVAVVPFPPAPPSGR